MHSLYALFKQKYLVLKLTYFILILNSTFYCTIYIMNDKYKTEIRNTIHWIFHYISICLLNIWFVPTYNVIAISDHTKSLIWVFPTSLHVLGILGQSLWLQNVYSIWNFFQFLQWCNGQQEIKMKWRLPWKVISIKFFVFARRYRSNCLWKWHSKQFTWGFVVQFNEHFLFY